MHVEQSSLMLITSMVICLKFCMITSTAGELTVESDQDGKPRSIGSYGTVVSRIANGDGDITATLFMSGIQVAFIFYGWAQPSQVNEKVSATVPVENLTFSATANTMNHTMTVTWNFTYLPENYSGLVLTTKAVTKQFGTTKEVAEANTSLEVVACKSPQTVSTINQTSFFNISAYTVGHFNKLGNCSCLNNDEVLFEADETRANVTATCAIDAQWVGCKNLQCWSGPKNIIAQQVKEIVNASKPFHCSFIEGFPNSTNIIFKLNGEAKSENYNLKSYDHGKNLSCQVVSLFTEKNGPSCESSPIEIKVYFSPENSTFSSDSPVIKVNRSKLLNYSTFANPNAGSVLTDVNSASGSDSSAEFSLVGNYTNNDIRHIFEFNISVRSDQDYGLYQVCASTTSPPGTDCANVTIYSNNPMDQGIPTSIIVAIVAGAILLVVIVAGVFVLCKWRKKASNKDNGKEEKVNELYGSAQYQAPSTGNSGSVKQEKTNVLYGSASGGASGDVVEYAMADPGCITSDDGVQYVSSNPDAGSEDTVVLTTTSASDQPCSSNAEIYAQVNKKKGNVNDGYNIEVHDSKPDTSAAAYTVIDKSKKRNKDDVPEVYAVVNKPRTKG